MSPWSPIITETHMNRSNRLLSSSLFLCVWLHVSTICETRPYVSLSHFCLSSFSFSLSHLHICMFPSSALVLLSLSQVLSSLLSFLCVFSPSSKSSPLVFASDVTWPLFSEESSWVTGQKVLWASLWISLPVSFQAQGHWGSLGVGGVRAQSRSRGFWQLYCG